MNENINPQKHTLEDKIIKLILFVFKFGPRYFLFISWKRLTHTYIHTHIHTLISPNLDYLYWFVVRGLNRYNQSYCDSNVKICDQAKDPTKFALFYIYLFLILKTNLFLLFSFYSPEYNGRSLIIQHSFNFFFIHLWITTLPFYFELYFSPTYYIYILKR